MKYSEQEVKDLHILIELLVGEPGHKVADRLLSQDQEARP